MHVHVHVWADYLGPRSRGSQGCIRISFILQGRGGGGGGGGVTDNPALILNMHVRVHVHCTLRHLKGFVHMFTYMLHV